MKKPVISYEFAEAIGLECSVIWVGIKSYEWLCVSQPNKEDFQKLLAENIACISIAFDVDVMEVRDMVSKEAIEFHKVAKEDQEQHIIEEQKKRGASIMDNRRDLEYSFLSDRQIRHYTHTKEYYLKEAPDEDNPTKMKL